MKIKLRDLLFFVLGLFTLYAIETITNWDETKESIKKGSNAYYQSKP